MTKIEPDASRRVWNCALCNRPISDHEGGLYVWLPTVYDFYCYACIDRSSAAYTRDVVDLPTFAEAVAFVGEVVESPNADAA